MRPSRHDSHGSESLKAWAQKVKEWSPGGVVKQTCIPVFRANAASCFIAARGWGSPCPAMNQPAEFG